MNKQESRKIRSAYSNGFQYSFGGGFVEKCNMTEVNRHAELLDEALEKQIPKKLKYESKMPKCPHCGSWIDNCTINAYCYHCGQALYWGL